MRFCREAPGARISEKEPPAVSQVTDDVGFRDARTVWTGYGPPAACWLPSLETDCRLDRRAGLGGNRLIFRQFDGRGRKISFLLTVAWIGKLVGLIVAEER